MPLFGRNRDRKLIKLFNKEVIEDILDTPVVIFKPSTVNTDTNLYGEGPDGYKKWRKGVRIHATVNRGDQEWSTNDFGLDIKQNITFSFLHEHVWAVRSEGTAEYNAFAIEPGDIVMYDSQYWEIDSTNRNQYLFGRNEHIAENISGDPFETEGESLSTVAMAHLTRRSKLNIEHPKHLRTGAPKPGLKTQGLYR